ncbi:hypothetical protein BC936DRAFT_145894 [Jimgerdemannia flammicorona]|uniref:Uncharacterized protein n=1 Tax=Jimgerdemannia flammicorona TaxID=994334 RepID=A0A433D8V2_9FUNG|nr:hypothetical protein BC936DRAFT_145894 [Jimgerdemannia flammicorona]
MSHLPSVLARRPILTALLTAFHSSGSADFALTYTTAPTWPLAGARTNGAPRIAILDSSFNPPTFAHRALLLHTLRRTDPPTDFDAALLLFSTTNADKQPGGTGPVERVMMMELAACTMASEISPRALAVGVTKHARFVDKAEAILRSLASSSSVTPELYFIMGLDTILRLFSPKYYPGTTVVQALGPFFARSKVVCADRAGVQEEEAVRFWVGEEVKEFDGRVGRVEIPEEARELSSTRAREAVRRGEWEEVERIVGKEVAQFVKDEGLYAV